jgi:hypothetical protein
MIYIDIMPDLQQIDELWTMHKIVNIPHEFIKILVNLAETVFHLTK